MAGGSTETILKRFFKVFFWHLLNDVYFGLLGGKIRYAEIQNMFGIGHKRLKRSLTAKKSTLIKIKISYFYD